MELSGWFVQLVGSPPVQFLTEAASAITQQQSFPGSGVGQSAGAGSPFTSYMAGVATYSLIVGALVTGLLGGAFVIINLGLLSKRPTDWVGKRMPSDLGILKSNIAPIVPYEAHALPAEEADAEDAGEELIDMEWELEKKKKTA